MSCELSAIGYEGSDMQSSFLVCISSAPQVAGSAGRTDGFRTRWGLPGNGVIQRCRTQLAPAPHPLGAPHAAGAGCRLPAGLGRVPTGTGRAVPCRAVSCRVVPCEAGAAGSWLRTAPHRTLAARVHFTRGNFASKGSGLGRKNLR